jgi:site-specific DNA-methyltransferase (adenine-specific)
MPRPRQYATAAERQRAYRARTRLAAVAPNVVCLVTRACTLYCSPWEPLYPLLPRHAAIVSDPPYAAGYDVTRPRRRPSRHCRNFVGWNQPFDPSPWLGFAEVVLCGADHYWDRLPQGGSWCYWDKLAGTTPSHFAPGEWIWLSRDGPPQHFTHLWRGGMRAGEENACHLQAKYHPAQKPVALMLYLVQQTTAPLVIDPYMGSGSTAVACLREGRPFIGIELDPEFFATACRRVREEVQQLPLFPTCP